MSSVDVLAELLRPWQSAYADSQLLATTLTGAHLLSLLAGGGLSVTADRATLRAVRHATQGWDAHLVELRAVRRPVLIAVATLLVSGVLLAAADVETFLSSPILWGKLALVALLLVDGAVMARAEGSLRRIGRLREIGFDVGTRSGPVLRRRLRTGAWVSLALWCAITLAGAALAGAL